MQLIIPALFVSYLFGAIPTAYIFGRLLKGVDIRKFGSGNVGATNAMRVLGYGPGITVLVLDILKGVIPVVFLGDFLKASQSGIPDELSRLLLGVACIAGHNWTVFLNFKGGKGIATTFGVLIGLAIGIPGIRIVLALVIACWFAVFFISRIISLASIAASIALPFLMIIFKQSTALIFASILLSAFALLRHKANLRRLIDGKEPRLSFKKTR